MSFGSKTKSSSTQTTTPAAKPDLEFALGENRNLFNFLQGRKAAPFKTYTDFSPETMLGLDLTRERALAGSPLTDAARGAATDIAGGGFLGDAGGYISRLASGQANNPAAAYFEATARGDYLDPATNPAFGAGVAAINDSVGSIFERAGRTGSGANQSSVARGVGDFAANIYNQERSNQLGASNALAGIYNSDVANSFGAGSLLNADAMARLSAAGLSPTLNAQDYADLQALMSVGSIKEGKDREALADNLYRFNFPYENAIQASGLLNSGVGGLGPLLGSTTTRDSVEETNPGLGSTILGGLLTAGQVLAGGPAGAALGAAGGGSSFVNPYSYLAGGGNAPSWAPSPISAYGS